MSLNSTPITVPAKAATWTQAWVDTTLDLTVGRFTITATGAIKINPGVEDTGPDGGTATAVQAAQMMAPSLTPFALIGKIGVDGTPFLVGSKVSLDVTTAGRLYLAVNDSYYFDNSGEFVATVAEAHSKVVVVPAKAATVTQAWIDTGIDTSGGSVSFTATGTIKINPSVPDTGPDGDPSVAKSSKAIAPALTCFALIGKIGSSGTPFLVGSASTQTATANGRLYLAVNDTYHFDNSGQFTVTVTW